ncbi:hypothetical protein [Pseudonocardia sp. HH130630-07]|uniref:hypothetical protein n=1 Tax=Pseudonocardia sp. HH130630-07 TaxID=1690815 RepID=UPI0012EAFD70|nr:hypothetical protein [Pseudonocardia sp. HH130630-07]
MREGLTRLLRDLDLRFCAADFAVDREGRWHHLDLDPVGRWAWDHPARDHIADALAAALTRKDLHR